MTKSLLEINMDLNALALWGYRDMTPAIQVNTLCDYLLNGVTFEGGSIDHLTKKICGYFFGRLDFPVSQDILERIYSDLSIVE